MSAVEKISQAGSGLKNIAIGVAVLAALAALVYAIVKGKQALTVVKDAGGYLFGSDTAARTLGTDLYDATHGSIDYTDPEQELKTCLALYPPGSGQNPVPGGKCEQIFKANGIR